jgi:ribosome-associated protein
LITTAKLQKTIVGALEDIKAREIEVFDVRHVTSLFDRVIIASADSGRQLKALASNVQARVKATGGAIISVEGLNSDEWVLVDTGDIVVHIMQPAIRAHYNLDELWNQPKPRKPRKPPEGRAKPTATDN